jgi:hypothetical protein
MCYHAQMMKEHSMQFPEVGTQVEVEIDTQQAHDAMAPDSKHRCGPTTVLKGTVVTQLPWMKEYFTIVNSQTKAHNFIAHHLIMSINKQKFDKPLPTQDKVMLIKSSNGKDTYTVIQNGITKKWSCPCAGFGFKKKCKHTLEAQAA